MRSTTVTVEKMDALFLKWNSHINATGLFRAAIREEMTERDIDEHEFQRVPPLERVEDPINTGRSLNAQAILGVQSVAQVQDTYGEDAADAVLSGLAQQVLMRVGDKSSIEYVRQQIGEERRSEVSVSFSDDGEREASRMRNETEHPFTESELRQFDTGQAVLTSEKGWVNGWLVMLEEVEKELDRAIERGR